MEAPQGFSAVPLKAAEFLRLDDDDTVLADALISKRRCTAFETLLTFWPPEPCARIAEISTS